MRNKNGVSIWYSHLFILQHSHLKAFLWGGGLSSYNDVREVHDALLLIFYNL